MSTVDENNSEYSESDAIISNTVDGVQTVVINRPDRKNAIDPAGWIALRDVFHRAGEDESVRAVVVTGANGDFSAGADLSGEHGQAHPLRRMQLVNEVASTLFHLPKPVVAKVRGVCAGAGWNLALCCDLVAAAEEARFSQIFVRRGLSPDFGGSWLLPRLVGMQQAKRLALLGDFVGASEASELGLVTWVVGDDDLDGFVADTAQRLAAAPPIAVAQSKALLHTATEQSFAEALDSEARAQTVNFATEDAATAREAFMRKTEPTFTGRWAVS